MAAQDAKRPKLALVDSYLVAEPFSFDEAFAGPPATAAYYASAELKRRLVTELMKPDYDEHIGALLRWNPDLSQQLRRLVKGTYQPSLSDDDQVERNREKVDFTLEIILSLLLRSRNQAQNHFLVACLSLLAYQSQLDHRFWNILARMKLLYHRSKTLELALALGTRLTPSTRADIPDNAVGVFTAFDNCAEFKHKSMQHVDKDRQNEMKEVNNQLFLKDTYLTWEDLGHCPDGAPPQ